MSARTPFVPNNSRPASRVANRKDQNADSSSNSSQFTPDLSNPLHAGTDASQAHSLQKPASSIDNTKISAINGAAKPLNLNGFMKKPPGVQPPGPSASRSSNAPVPRRSSLENASNDTTNAINTLIRRDAVAHTSINLVTPIPRAAAQSNNPLYQSNSPVLQSVANPFKTPAVPMQHSPAKSTHISSSTAQDDLHREQFRFNTNMTTSVPPQRILVDDNHTLPGLIPKNRTKRTRPDATAEEEQETDLVYLGESNGPAKRYKSHHHSDGSANIDYMRQSFSPQRFSSPIDDPSQSDYHRSPKGSNMYHHQHSGDGFMNISQHPGSASQGQNSLDRLLGCQAHVFVEDHMEWYQQLSTKWRECTMEEWVKGADEIMDKYSKILDLVKKHMETKLKLFTSFDTQVANHRLVLDDRAKLLDGVKQRLVSNSQTILGCQSFTAVFEAMFQQLDASAIREGLTKFMFCDRLLTFRTGMDTTLSDQEPSPTLLCPECFYTFNAHRKICSPVTLEKIRTNHLPTPSEASLIQEWIADTTKDFERYDAEIDRLLGILRKLMREKEYLLRYTDEYRTLLSPIRRLPPEVLTQIFELLCCQDEPSVLRKTVSVPPLRIAQTCAVWRQLAFNTPSLWSSFHVELGAFPGNLQLLSTYLKLSGDHPLSITLHCGRGPEWDGIILQTILEHAWRWKSLSLFNADRIRDLPSPPDLPMLETLELSSELFRSSAMFKFTPKLRNLILDDVEFEDLEEEYFPCSQLTSVTLRRVQIGNVLRTLDSCPNLQEAVISCRRNFSWSPPVEHSPPIHLSHLTNLTLTTEFFSDFFDNIATPALSSLTITTHAQPHNLEPWPQEVFISFLQRSLCPIKHLSFLNIELSDKDLLAILEFTPLLTHLSIKESSEEGAPATITNQFLRQLAFPKTAFRISRAPPLPKLEFVDFVTHESRIDYGLVMDLLSSRSSERAQKEGYSAVKDVSVRQGFIDIPESVVPQHIIPKVGVALAPIIDRITNRIFALGGSVVSPTFSAVRLIIPGLA
ncbi:hypothetical protein VNI00_010741 [Paramarasmius palmivorus]|uniref:F-box domain-containing protein n=1 Tax=Paramarasmius palmivorus TaxID=297713 RepID=A0AAW0CH66_9AGAR